MALDRIQTPRGYWRGVATPERRGTMTICIAAAANVASPERRAIIFCSDTRMSGALGTAELRRKDYMLRAGWICLMSGNENDILALVPLLNRSFQEPEMIDETNVCQLVRNALNRRKREKVEELVQGRYGLSYDDFLRTGKTNFPEVEFRITMSDISNMRLNACCLIGGFAAGVPSILQSDENCSVSIRENFATIGEGSHLATAMLLHRGHHEVDVLERALYNVYEAKKLAENVTSVGKLTAITILYEDNRWNMLTVTDQPKDILEQKFNLFGPRPRPIPVFTPEELAIIFPPDREMGLPPNANENAAGQSS